MQQSADERERAAAAELAAYWARVCEEIPALASIGLTFEASCDVYPEALGKDPQPVGINVYSRKSGVACARCEGQPGRDCPLCGGRGYFDE